MPAQQGARGDDQAQLAHAPLGSSRASAAMTSAEILQVRVGQIVRGELIFDAQELRAAMAAGA